MVRAQVMVGTRMHITVRTWEAVLLVAASGE